MNRSDLFSLRWDENQIRSLRSLPIEGVAERLGMRPARHRHKALCPFHDDHNPSLSFYVRGNKFRCFACGASGGTIDLVMKYLNKDFREAAKWLADEHSIILSEKRFCGQSPKVNVQCPKPFDAARYARFFERPHLCDAARRFLFQERGLHPAVVSYCRLNTYGEWLQIPYYDRQGTLTGIQNRYLGNDPAQPRFRFPPGAQCGLYNLPVLNRLARGEPLYITEGASDCWAMLSAGHKAVAVPSATMLKPHDISLLRTLADERDIPLHIYPDRDEAGEELYRQLSQVLPQVHRHQLPDGCKDFSEYYLLRKI